MNRWDYKRLVHRDGVVEYGELTEQQKAKVQRYETALEAARASKVSNPKFSNYHVMEGISFGADAAVQAGNIEYGFCQALHGEETAVAALRSLAGRENNGVIVLGIIAGSQNLPAPCGNCRDLMLDELGTDFELVSGPANGGLAVVANISDYLFSDFRKVTDFNCLPRGFEDKVAKAVEEGSRLVNDAYSPQTHIRKYYALISTAKEDFIGAIDTTCDYHPIYPLRDAARAARRAHNPYIEYVIIAAEKCGDKAPHVMYKDRQHLLELNTQAELASGAITGTFCDHFNPPVYLVTLGYCSEKFRILAAYGKRA